MTTPGNGLGCDGFPGDIGPCILPPGVGNVWMIALGFGGDVGKGVGAGVGGGL